MKSYRVVDEDAIFDIAWDVALKTGCSGFDSYFISVAKKADATLFTDDSGMHIHAKGVGANSVLIKNADLKEIQRIFE